MLKSGSLFIISLFACYFMVVSGVSYAETPDMASIVKKVESGKLKSNVIRLTTNRNEFVQLEQDASSVIVNNPAHASVMLDTPRLLIIVPHQPGVTSFTVLDQEGKTILQKDIIVSNVEKKYVRVRRMCGDDPSCRPDSYYYCPDGCYEVSTVQNSGNNSAPLRPSGYSDADVDQINYDGSSNENSEAPQQNNNEQNGEETAPE